MAAVAEVVEPECNTFAMRELCGTIVNRGQGVVVCEVENLEIRPEVLRDQGLLANDQLQALEALRPEGPKRDLNLSIRM